MNFYTLKEAANAIAAKMHPCNEKNRTEAARCYVAALDNAVGTNGIVYRDPVTRLPLQREGIAASLAAHSCVVSELDLNAWLDSLGVGVRVAAPYEASETTSDIVDDEQKTNPRPSSSEIASALGPFLSRGRDGEWLRRRLNDADRYGRLQKFRVMEGKRPVARWEVGGVVLYLIEGQHLTLAAARQALHVHYPRQLHVINHIQPPPRRTATASWIPRDVEPS